MAESTIKREPMAVPQKEYGRREFLKKAGKTAAVVGAYGSLGVLGGAVGLTAGQGVGEMVSAQTKEKLGEVEFKAKEMVVGDIKITKEANPRGQTILGPNLVGWNIIEKLNGTNIKNVSELKIRNSLILEGESPDGPEKGRWIPVVATMNQLGISWDELVYFSLSGETEKAGVVVPDRNAGAKFQPIKNRDEKGFSLQDGSTISRDQTGKVIIPQTSK